MVWVHKWNRWNLQLFIIVNIIENKRLKARTDHHVLLLRDAGVHGHKRLKTRSCDHITSCAFDSALRCWCACVYNLYPLQRTWCITVWSECAVKSVCFGSSLVSLQFLTHLWNQSSWGDKEAIALEGWWLISAFQTALIMCIYIYICISCAFLLKVLVRLCNYVSPAEELARKDDLSLLFSAITSWCVPHNIPWRQSAGEVLVTLSRHGLTPSVVKYIHGQFAFVFHFCLSASC